MIHATLQLGSSGDTNVIYFRGFPLFRKAVTDRRKSTAQMRHLNPPHQFK